MAMAVIGRVTRRSSESGQSSGFTDRHDCARCYAHRCPNMITAGIIMSDERRCIAPLALLRLLTWLSPTFPIGSYSYSHGLEWGVDAGHIHDCLSLVDWLEADLCFGSGRNEEIFFVAAWRSARENDQPTLFDIAELAAAFRGTSEFALESAQQATSCLSTLRHVWPDRILDWLSESLSEHQVQASLAVVLGISSAGQEISLELALPAFLQSYIAN